MDLQVHAALATTALASPVPPSPQTDSTSELDLGKVLRALNDAPLDRAVHYLKRLLKRSSKGFHVRDLDTLNAIVLASVTLAETVPVAPAQGDAADLLGAVSQLLLLFSLPLASDCAAQAQATVGTAIDTIKHIAGVFSKSKHVQLHLAAGESIARFTMHAASPTQRNQGLNHQIVVDSAVAGTSRLKVHVFVYCDLVCCSRSHAC
jgi:hypothetical protein